MIFELMNQIGLSGFDYSYIFIGLAGFSLILLILVIIQMFELNKLKKKYKKFMGGKDVKSLEKQIEKIFEDNRYIQELSDSNNKEIRTINKEKEFCFNKVGIIKYDAFQQMGGMLSFSIALLNEKDNGFILNSVHSTEGCYTYVKEIKAGICDIDLSKEEKDALFQAMKKSN